MQSTIQMSPSDHGDGRGSHVSWATAALCVIAGFVFIYRRGQDVNYDLLAYHYFSGYSALAGRMGLDVAPMGIQSYFNPLPNVLSYLAYSKLAFPWSAFSPGAIQLASIPLLVLIAGELRRGFAKETFPIAGALAIVLGVMSPLWLSELGTSFYSSTTAPLVMGGVLFMLRAVVVSGSRSKVRLVICGALLGIATGLKMTNAIYAVAAVTAVAAACHACGRRVVMRSLLALGVGLVAGFASMAWWNYSLYVQFGNPIFPLYNAIFHSPYASQSNFRDLRWAFESFGQWFEFMLESFTGTRKTSELAFADARILIVALAAVSALCVAAFKRRRITGDANASGSAFLWFMGTSVVLWSAMFAYQRYFIVNGLLLGCVLWVLLEQLHVPPRSSVIVLAAAVVATGMFIHIPDWGHIPPSDRSANPFGLAIPQALATTPANYLVAGAPDAFVLASLHPGSHFLRIDYDSHVDVLIEKALSEDNSRSVLLFATDATLDNGIKSALRFGFVPDAAPCGVFRSSVNTYRWCRMRKARAAD